jgi:hypothetical protein
MDISQSTTNPSLFPTLLSCPLIFSGIVERENISHHPSIHPLIVLTQLLSSRTHSPHSLTVSQEMLRGERERKRKKERKKESERKYYLII